MEESKQQNQKTVVAFIAGLLIGGLLVWVFTAADETAEPEDDRDDNSAVEDEGEDLNLPTDDEDEDTTNEDENETTPTTNDDEDEDEPTATGNGTLDVNDQAAGGRVMIADIEYPRTEGWIAVHELNGNNLGNVLGAARFNTTAGLRPTSVTLLRNTVADRDYRIVFYSENGDRTFNTATDRPISGVASATFTAE